jgi:hypothetical protein
VILSSAGGTSALNSLHEPPFLPLLAGFALWAALTAFAFASSWALAASLLRDRGALARLQLALLLQAALTLTAVQGLGALGVLYRPALIAAGLVLFMAAFACKRGSVRDLFAQDLQRVRSFFGEAWTEREILTLALLACAIPYGAQALIIYCFRSWTWDPAWYHVPITNYAITEHGLGFLASHNIRAAGFTRNLELLSVWNVLLPKDSQLDDLAQAPFCLLAFVSMAAWARDLKAPRSLAAGLGAALLLAPPTFLQAASTHVDIACAALLLTVWQQWTQRRFGRLECAIGCIALFLYIGTKFTGLYHAGLLLPLFAIRCFFGRRRGVVRDFVWLVPLGFWLGGGLIYLHNLRTYGNPIWPIETKVLGLQLKGGGIDASQEWVPPFFKAAGSFSRMWHSWYEVPGEIWPDIRGGGFGPLYRWLTLPCCLILLLNLVRRRDLVQTASVLGLLALALSVPDAWWPRFTLCAAAAALASTALVWEQLRFAWPRRALSLATLALACWGIAEGWPGIYPLRYTNRALRTPHLARSLIQPADWLWTEEMCRMREQELRAGDAVAFDDSIFFMSDLWTTDLRNRVIYIQHPADLDHDSKPWNAALDQQYLDKLKAENVTWAAVRPGKSAERALLKAGGTRLFLTPRYQSAIVRTPWAHAQP